MRYGSLSLLICLLTLVAGPGLAQGGSMLQVKLAAPGTGEPGAPLAGQLTISNRGAQEIACQLEMSLQRDSGYYDQLAPDAVHGLDRAVGMTSWTELDGKRVEEGSITDGKDWTCANLLWRSTPYSEVFQYIDLRDVRSVTHLSYYTGEADCLWLVDVSASADGATYTPVPELQNVNLNKKYGRQQFPASAPFRGRFLKFRYHVPAGTRADVYRLPTTISVFTGAQADDWQIPSVGRVLKSDKQTLTIPAGGERTVELPLAAALPTGAYFAAVRVQSGAETQLLYHHYHVFPAPMAKVNERFGVNVAEVKTAPLHRRLGVGWVRFENLKGLMMSPEPHKYGFDGTVAPWKVNADQISQGYADQGIQVLPFLFLSMPYNTTGKTNSQRDHCYPPRDNAQWAEFTFQTAARYGAEKHPAADLLTTDKRSGMKLLSTYEIWNEPDLNDRGWGSWVGSMAQYYEMLRASSEAIKRADPNAKVSNGGLSDIDVKDVDELRTFTYADGKHPLDFIDVLNGHFYTGRTAPEIATVNANYGKERGKKITYEESLQRLADWRDVNKPGLPIWLTETGYDTSGHASVTERIQAAWLPRDLLIALASGMDKVFVYREADSGFTYYAASGQIRRDMSLKPSWFTFATLIRQLDGATEFARLPYHDANVRVYAWRQQDKLHLAAWTVEGAGTLQLPLGACAVTDAFGATGRVANAENFPLTIFPVYLGDISNVSEVERLLTEAARIKAARLQALRQ